MKIKKTLINALFGITLASASARVFGFASVGEIYCNVNSKTIRTDNVIDYISTSIYSVPVISFDNRDFKTINYLKTYEACYKKYKEGSFSIDNIPVIDEPSSLDVFMKDTKLIQRFKLDDFFHMSEDTFSNFDLFQRDTPRALDTYIMIREPNKAKIITPPLETSIALFLPSTSKWKGPYIFRQTGAEVNVNDIPLTASAAVSAMATTLSDRLIPRIGLKYDNELSENLAKFIVITSNQSSFDSLINNLFFGTNEGAMLYFVAANGDKKANYYQIVPNKISNKKIEVVYTQMIEFTKIRKIDRQGMKEVKFTKPVTVAVSIPFTLKKDRNTLNVGINYAEYKIEVSGGNPDDKRLMLAILKGGAISTDPAMLNSHSRTVVSKTKNMVLEDF